jgi:hypothetical protein
LYRLASQGEFDATKVACLTAGNIKINFLLRWGGEYDAQRFSACWQKAACARRWSGVQPDYSLGTAKQVFGASGADGAPRHRDAG